jgi:Uma2 family endonuclease
VSRITGVAAWLGRRLTNTKYIILLVVKRCRCCRDDGIARHNHRRKHRLPRWVVDRGYQRGRPDRDLHTKRLEYGRAGIPECWIVHPRENAITVLQLTGEQYEVFDRFGDGNVVTPPTLGDAHIAVSDVFRTQ